MHLRSDEARVSAGERWTEEPVACWAQAPQPLQSWADRGSCLCHLIAWNRDFQLGFLFDSLTFAAIRSQMGFFLVAFFFFVSGHDLRNTDKCATHVL